MRIETDLETKKLYCSILEGLFRKKARHVVEIDLEMVNNSVTRYFIICHGESNTQVRSISESIEEQVKIDTDISAWHKEGTENLQWVLLDYIDIVVHIFQKPFRDYYNLEELWADGKVKEIHDDGNLTKIIKEDECRK